MSRAHIRSVTLSMLLCAAVLACGLGCGDQAAGAAGPSGTVSVAAAQQPPPANVSPDAKLVDAYLAVHERLAADDLAGAKKAFGKLVQVASSITSVHATKLKVAASDGAAAADIEAQRKAFEPASEAVIALVQASGNPLPKPVYIARCPMAFDRGARWLQRSDKIANPYFGASMLTCGSIDATIPPGRKS